MDYIHLVLSQSDVYIIKSALESIINVNNASVKLLPNKKDRLKAISNVAYLLETLTHLSDEVMRNGLDIDYLSNPLAKEEN